MKYFPKDILGIDIDYALINKAVENFLVLEKSHVKNKGGMKEKGRYHMDRKEGEKKGKEEEENQE